MLLNKNLCFVISFSVPIRDLLIHIRKKAKQECFSNTVPTGGLCYTCGKFICWSFLYEFDICNPILGVPVSSFVTRGTYIWNCNLTKRAIWIESVKPGQMQMQNWERCCPNVLAIGSNRQSVRGVESFQRKENGNSLLRSLKFIIVYLGPFYHLENQCVHVRVK